MALQIQTDQSPTHEPQLGVALGGFGGAATTDLSLATPGFVPSLSLKSTERRNPKIIMNRRFSRNGNGSRLELRLNLSPTRAVGRGPVSPGRAIGSVSPASSCVSSEADEVEPAKLMMVVVGCPRCLMYVMIVPEDGVDSKCPRCKSRVLLDVVSEPAATRATNGTAAPAAAHGGAKRIRKN